MTPPAKRKRTVSRASVENVQLQQESLAPKASPDVYMNDGNIVIIAGATAFRVHQSQLSRHSEVFRDMLTVGAQDNNELYDGCAVVRVSDSREDMTFLLKALYDTTRFDMQRFHELSSVLILATKYLIDHLRRAILDLLREAYPDTLDDWEAYNGLRPDPQAVIVIARRVNAEILLPSAFYHLCSFSPLQVMKNPRMPFPDIASYYIGREEISKWWPKVTSEMLDEPLAGDLTCSEICREDWDWMWDEEQRRAFDHWTNEGGECDPLRDMQACLELFREPGEETQLCQECATGGEDELDIEKGVLWDSLPRVFGLGTWDGIRNGS